MSTPPGRRRASTPDTRAADAKRRVASVRRKYKIDLNKRRSLLPGEIPHVIDTIIVLKLAGYSRSQMAKVIGVSRGQIREFLELPEVEERLVTLRQALPQAALNLLQGYMIEAVQAIVDVMRRTDDDRYILQAAGEILDRAGLPKASRQERHVVQEEKTVITDDGIVDALREASPEVQEQAAQLIEQLEKILGGAIEETTEADGEAL
jgi:hypothetical protein